MDARILLVEDDPSIREITAIGLRNAGFDVDVAVDGQAGLDRFHAAPYDLVLLDVMLPRLDGLEVCRAIRRGSTVPVVMLTARADTIDVVVGLEAGADDYVKKPFEVPELVARVRAAIRRAGREAGEPELMRLGPLAIDLAGRTVSRDGRDIALTRTEFDLLVELARNPGRVLTRDVLLDRIWGYDYLGDSRLVDVAIQRVRAKIETDPAAPDGVVVAPGKFNAGTGTAALDRVLSEPFARACADVKARFAHAQTPQHAADWIERAFAAAPDQVRGAAG